MSRLTALPRAICLAAAMLLAPGSAFAIDDQEGADLTAAARAAEQSLRQTFTNLAFENFKSAPVKGPIYQASAGGQIIYYAPESEHVLFATVYDRSGVNLTALAQGELARERIRDIDPAHALVLGPADAPTVIEFTDPDCPYCRALDRFWNAQAALGRPVRRLVYFVSGIHPEAAAKAEHILCSPDPAAAQHLIYAGEAAAPLLRCPKGAEKVAADARTVKAMGVSGTPTIFLDGKLVSGFQQAEIEAFLDEKYGARHAP